MIVTVAALLIAASLSAGLRATSGWLDHWHPADRLVLSVVLGGMFIAAALTLSARSGIADAGYGLAFSLAPVGVYDVAKWWFRSRATRTAWLTRARAAGWLIAVRWAAVVTAVAGMTWVSVLQWQESSKPAPAPAIIDQPIKHKVPVKPNEAFDPTDPDLNPPRG